jgi:hypothetical protein
MMNLDGKLHQVSDFATSQNEKKKLSSGDIVKSFGSVKQREKNQHVDNRILKPGTTLPQIPV